MFSKTDREIKASANGAGGVKVAPSIISDNLHIIGNLSTDGEMQVDGSIKGDVTSQALTVGEKASISGEIVADHIEIHGSVSGKIRARKIKLAKTAKVKAASVPEQTAAKAQSSASLKPAVQTSDHNDEKVAVKRAAGS
jgi:predicted acyltransferase (DUF342 family)